MMKKMYIMLMLCAMVCTAQAQLLTRNYRGETLSHVLEDLNAATGNYEIAFVYNDLEYFTVTCSFSRVSLDEALRRVVGFYPVRILKDGGKIFVECTQKTERHLTGTVIDENGHPLVYRTRRDSLSCHTISIKSSRGCRMSVIKPFIGLALQKIWEPSACSPTPTRCKQWL